MSSPTVLTVTKRLAEVCASQAILHAAGVSMITATDSKVVRSVVNTLDVRGIILCKHSWSDEERETLHKEIVGIAGDLHVMQCPGCTGSDDKAGSLFDVSPLIQLIDAVRGGK